MLKSVSICFNRPCSIYQYSCTAPRLSGQNCKFFKFLLSFNSQKRLGYKENNTKYRMLTWKPRSHVRILIYRTWPILVAFHTDMKQKRANMLFKILLKGKFLRLLSSNSEVGNEILKPMQKINQNVFQFMKRSFSEKRNLNWTLNLAQSKQNYLVRNTLYTPDRSVFNQIQHAFLV